MTKHTSFKLSPATTPKKWEVKKLQKIIAVTVFATVLSTIINSFWSNPLRPPSCAHSSSPIRCPYTPSAPYIKDYVFMLLSALSGLIWLGGLILILVYWFWGLSDLIRGSNDKNRRTNGVKRLGWATLGLAILIGIYAVTKILSTK